MPAVCVKVQKICVQCGASFEASKANAHKARFCSGACRTALYRKEERYVAERDCLICHKRFTVAVPSEKTRTCSRACGQTLSMVTRDAASLKASDILADDNVVVLSETVQVFRGVAYYLCDRYFQHDGVRLHRTVWESLYGPIPAGFDVHHKDENRSNNQPDNLEALPQREHRSGRHGQAAALRVRKYLAKAQAAAPAWHRSEEGRAWHSEQAKRNIAVLVLPQIPKTCEQCGKEYLAPRVTARTQRFCSARCKTAWRYAQGVDRENRVCVVCTKVFTVRSKYESTKTCSHSCATKSWRNFKTP